MPVRRGVSAAVAASSLVALMLGGCSGSSSSSSSTTSPTPAAAPGPIVSITGLPPWRQLAPGGRALTFTVSVRNTGSHAYQDITLVISMGHCACTNTKLALAPEGTLRERDPATGIWRRVPYNREGSGTKFLRVVQQPGFTLKPKARASFPFRVAFSARQEPRFQAGASAINITVVQLPAHTSIGAVPGASVRIQVSR
jgi:hypothetical protein